jgi:hypothetical protein
MAFVSLWLAYLQWCLRRNTPNDFLHSMHSSEASSGTHALMVREEKKKLMEISKKVPGYDASDPLCDWWKIPHMGKIPW